MSECLHKQAVKLTQALKSVQLTYFGPPPPTRLELGALEKAAYERGYEAASQAYAHQIAEVREEMHRLQTEILDHVQKEYKGLLESIQASLPSLLISIANKLVPNLPLTVESLQAIIQEAIGATLSPNDTLTICLCPEDHAILTKNARAWLDEHPAIKLQEDPTLARGDCKLLSGFGLIDGRMETKLRKLAQAF